MGFIRRAVGLVLLRLLQRRRTPPPGPLRPLARVGLDADVLRRVLAVLESAVEGSRRALRTRALVISVRLLDDFRVGIVLALLPRTATSRAHACHYRQLPGAGVLDPAGSRVVGRRPASGADVGDCAGSVSDCDCATAETRRDVR